MSTNVIHVGEVVRLTLQAEHARDVTFQPPDIGRGKEIVVRKRDARTQTSRSGPVRTTVDYELTSFVVSNHVVSGGPVLFVQPDGAATEEPFPALPLSVQTTLTDASVDRRDIKDLATWPAPFPRWLPALVIVAILAGIAALVASRFLSRPRTILQYPPAPPPHELALQALRDLLARGWIESGSAEPFYVSLSGIVRCYIEGRFKLRAPERTTEEFIREAANSRLLSQEHQRLTREFLEQSDMVKFARHQPAQDDMKAAYASAERLVCETIPAPESPSPIPHSP